MRMMDFVNEKLKKNLEISNPKLVKSQSWFFSNAKKRVVKIVIVVMVFFWLVMVWSIGIDR